VTMAKGLLISADFARQLRAGVRRDHSDLPGCLSVHRAPRRQGNLLTVGGWKFGKLNGDLNGGAGERVSASVWKLNDAEDDWESAGDDLDDVYAPPLLAVGDTLDSGTWVIVHKHADGRWYVTNAACS